VAADQLKDVRFFEFLSEEERAAFVEASEPVRFEAGEEIIREGEDQGSMYVLTSGKVEVYKRVPNADDRLLATIDAGSGTVVGERGLLGRSGASATVRAVEEVEAIRLPRQTFRAMISEGQPAAYKLAYQISRTLARRLTRLDEEIARAIRELERESQETDLEVFRDKLITEWSV
jgi:CRP/FNR family cyclic AMP-dependent transcriptional regulator